MGPAPGSGSVPHSPPAPGSPLPSPQAMSSAHFLFDQIFTEGLQGVGCWGGDAGAPTLAAGMSALAMSTQVVTAVTVTCRWEALENQGRLSGEGDAPAKTVRGRRCRAKVRCRVRRSWQELGREAEDYALILGAVEKGDTVAGALWGGGSWLCGERRGCGPGSGWLAGLRAGQVWSVTRQGSLGVRRWPRGALEKVRVWGGAERCPHLGPRGRPSPGAATRAGVQTLAAGVGIWESGHP